VIGDLNVDLLAVTELDPFDDLVDQSLISWLREELFIGQRDAALLDALAAAIARPERISKQIVAEARDFMGTDKRYRLARSEGCAHVLGLLYAKSR
jgi:hypothetical protein